MTKAFYKKVCFIWKDQTTRTLILAVLIILVMGSLRPNKPQGINPKQYWRDKSQWKHCADMVLAGDSRVLMALSPAEMEKILTDLQIVNYGFGGVWYSRDYLEAIENVLDPNSNMKVIVLAISPRSLTEGTKNNKGNFTEVHNAHKKDAVLELFFAPVLQFLEPMSFDDAIDGAFPSLASSIVRMTYYPDGWVSSTCEVNRRGKWVLNRYRRLYKKYAVMDSTVQNVMDYVSIWRDKGITVYGFFPPSCSEMRQIEQNLESFNQDPFIKKFERHGGIWIDVNQTDYDSFDGCHLQDKAAVEFSADFAGAVKQIE